MQDFDISEASEKLERGQECFQIVVMVAENYPTIYIKLWPKVCLATSLLREARAQPPNLVNLHGAENFRSASLSSRDNVRHKNPSLLVINYLLLLARPKHVC